MKKIYLKLTEDQKKRGVIFSSALSYDRTDTGDLIHEVFKNDDKKEASDTIKRLLDDSFFNNSLFKYNIIRK